MSTPGNSAAVCTNDHCDENVPRVRQYMTFARSSAARLRIYGRCSENFQLREHTKCA